MENKRNIEEIDYEIKVHELKRIKKESQKNPLNWTAYITIIVALISLLGTFVANYIQKNNQLELERQKFESELIITAVKSNDLKTSRDNLKFLIDVGLIKDNSIQLKKILNDSSVPILRFKPLTNINPIYSLEGKIIIPKNIDFKRIYASIYPHSAKNTTEHLKQQITITNEGKFRIENLEEIGYILEFRDNYNVLKSILYIPNKNYKNEIKTYDLTKCFK